MGDRGFNFDYANGVLKVSVFPASKANPPPDKGSWRRSGAAPATTKAPYKHPRAAKHEAAGAKPALPSASPHSPDCLSKEQHQPRAADSTGNSRQRRREWRAANSAAAAPAASQPPLSPSKPCAEAADPPAAGLREAVALPPGLDAASTKRRVREVVVFPLNGRPWDSDFHPYHDAMRLWWLLEFAIAAKRQGLSVFFSLQRQVSSLGEPRQAMAMAHNRAHWPRADCCARQARCAAGSTKRLSGLRRAST